MAPIDPIPPSTIVDPSSSTSPARSSGVLRDGTPVAQTRGRPFASLWWPGALAIVLGVLITVGARRVRPQPQPQPQPLGVDLVAPDENDVLVDLDAAERAADAPAERMAVQLERLRSTAPPVGRRRGHP